MFMKTSLASTNTTTTNKMAVIASVKSNVYAPMVYMVSMEAFELYYQNKKKIITRILLLPLKYLRYIYLQKVCILP